MSHRFTEQVRWGSLGNRAFVTAEHHKNFGSYFLLFQAPLIPRARSRSESSSVSVKEDEGEASDEADKTSSQNAAQREKPGDVKGRRKVGTRTVGQAGESGPRHGPPASPPAQGWVSGRGAWEPQDLPSPLQNSGFGWFSWFRSKPGGSTSGEEDSSDSPDAEVPLGEARVSGGLPSTCQGPELALDSESGGNRGFVMGDRGT